MSLSIVDTSKVKTQSGFTKTNTLNAGFTDYLAAAAAPASVAVGLQAGYTPSAMIAATSTGIIGANQSITGNANAAAAPYLGTAATPFASGGYGYSGATYSPGYAGAAAGTGISYGTSGTYGSTSYGTTGAPSQDYQEKQALFQQMNDANWEMLVAQVTVNDLSRDYQARSNILKTKSDAEANSVRNMKA
jgi:hypothetical protein